MGAFLCSENHLSLLANLASDDPAVQDAAFALLLAENLRSLETRYPYDDASNRKAASDFKRRNESAAKLVDEALETRAKNGVKLLVPDAMLQTQVVKACECYDYQACESFDYYQTPAAAVVDKIRTIALTKGGQKEGKLYNDLIWGLY